MRLLHTGDWHVGKMLKGRSRAEEHSAVLDEIVDIAREHVVDVALIAGDLYDTAAPSPESEQIVYGTLLQLADTVDHVVVIAGNHDNPRRFSAVKPLLELTRVHATPSIVRPDEGGSLKLQTNNGETVQIAMLPFVSQRGIVRADDLMAEDADQHAMKFADRLTQVIKRLCGDGDPHAVNILLGHAMVHGGVMGGGERSAHTIFDYSIPTTAFPSHLQYVALGHLHRSQVLPAGCPVHYSGSPLQLDFGEEQDAKSVKIITAEAGRPATVDEVRLKASRRLLTVRGSLLQISTQIEELAGHYLRVDLDEAPRLGLADEVRDMLPNVVEVRIDREVESSRRSRSGRENRSPIQLLDEYLETVEVSNEDALKALFKELLEEHYEAETH